MSSFSPSNGPSSTEASGARDRAAPVQPPIWVSDPDQAEGWARGPFWGPDLGYEKERWVTPGQELHGETPPLVAEIGKGGEPIRKPGPELF